MLALKIKADQNLKVRNDQRVEKVEDFILLEMEIQILKSVQIVGF